MNYELGKPRVNTTTFRYSDDVRNCIDQFSGVSLADKIENALISSYVDLQSKERTIKEYDMLIDRKKVEFAEIVAELKKMSYLRDSLKDLDKLIKRIL